MAKEITICLTGYEASGIRVALAKLREYHHEDEKSLECIKVIERTLFGSGFV